MSRFKNKTVRENLNVSLERDHQVVGLEVQKLGNDYFLLAQKEKRNFDISMDEVVGMDKIESTRGLRKSLRVEFVPVSTTRPEILSTRGCLQEEPTLSLAKAGEYRWRIRQCTVVSTEPAP